MKCKFSVPLLLMLSSSVLLFSCKKELSSKQSNPASTSSAGNSQQDLKINTFYGPQVQMGDGKARSWITISHTDVPQEIGIELTNDALKGLPTDASSEISFILSLHQKAQQVTPFDHIEIDWNPFGHPPPGIYDLPHFDFHFYKISLAEQMAIPPYTPATAPIFDKAPPTGYLPAIYQPIPGGVPQMGKHWFNPTSPEWQGHTFTNTLIYGTYNGAVIFIEPMITMAVIQSGASITADIPQPQYYSPTNTYYPTKYNIYMDEKTQNHYITLSGFVLR